MNGCSTYMKNGVKITKQRKAQMEFDRDVRTMKGMQ